MTFGYVWRRYWRIPVVALLGSLLAFSGSFLLDPTYDSTTRLLIRARDTSFLTSTGQDLTSQSGVVDSTLSKSLAETYAGVATSRTIAIAVVDSLALDTKAADRTGPIAAVSRSLAWLYRCGRAFITAGFCADVDDREKAINEVQEGVTAGQLGVTTGEAAGQPGSYILEIGATGTTAEQARNVTNAVADQLVKASDDRFRADVDQHIQALQQQVAIAEQDVVTKGNAVADFKTANGISAADEQQVLSATAHETMQTDLLNAQRDLADKQAQLQSVNSSLASVPDSQDSTQRIQTGRSETEIQTNSSNPVYNDLLTTQAGVQADIDGLNARIAELQAQLNAANPLSLNGPQAQLAVLQQTLDLARANQTALTGQLQQAQTNAAISGAELTRIDEAALPTYPIGPKRYLYLALGFLLGGLAGGALTWLARRRQDPSGPVQPRDHDNSGSSRETLDNGENAATGESLGLFELNSASGGPAELEASPEPARGNGGHFDLDRRVSAHQAAARNGAVDDRAGAP